MSELSKLWIPYPEKSPKEWGPYLVTLEGKPTLMMWDGYWNRFGFPVEGVTAWMPTVNVRGKPGWADWQLVKDRKPEVGKTYLVLGRYSFEGTGRGSSCMDLGIYLGESEDVQYPWISQVWNVTQWAEIPETYGAPQA